MNTAVPSISYAYEDLNAKKVIKSEFSRYGRYYSTNINLSSSSNTRFDKVAGAGGSDRSDDSVSVVSVVSMNPAPPPPTFYSFILYLVVMSAVQRIWHQTMG